MNIKMSTLSTQFRRHHDHLHGYSMFDTCRIASVAGCMCRFQAILSIQEGVSVFRVVETNDFNQLPHITLAFRQGNDAAVKSFLAGRLSEVRASHTTLERDLSRAQVGSPVMARSPAAAHAKGYTQGP